MRNLRQFLLPQKGTKDKLETLSKENVDGDGDRKRSGKIQIINRA